jgi:hypothetical protein
MQLEEVNMAKRDKEKTLRNKIINEMTEQLKSMLPEVLKVTGFSDELSLNAKIGSKHANFIDIKNEVILSPEQFVALWMNGLIKHLVDLSDRKKYSNDYELQQLIKKHEVVKDYAILFLKRTYLRNFDALSKQRPSVEEATVWIGQENASYGILITPRFKNNNWENDKSEIRHFVKDYWTIGHIMETGLVIPFEQDIMKFSDVDQYLTFFKNTLVRASGSKHEKAIADRYCKFVRDSENPSNIPLLIPEYRYGGIDKKHLYRLDFTIIDPYTLRKFGFELSPWSTHGELTGIKGKSQKEINEIAKANFEKEMKKHKDFFRTHGIYALIYTDSDLQDPDAVFEDMKKYLSPSKASVQLIIHAIDEFLKYE